MELRVASNPDLLTLLATPTFLRFSGLWTVWVQVCTSHCTSFYSQKWNNFMFDPAKHSALNYVALDMTHAIYNHGAFAIDR